MINTKHNAIINQRMSRILDYVSTKICLHHIRITQNERESSDLYSSELNVNIFGQYNVNEIDYVCCITSPWAS